MSTTATGWVPSKETPTPTTATIARIREDAELVAAVRRTLDDWATTTNFEEGHPLRSKTAGLIVRNIMADRGLAVSRFTDWKAVGEAMLTDPMDAARLECPYPDGPHTCLDDPEHAARYAEFVIGDAGLPTVPEGDDGAPVNGFEVAACAYETDDDGAEHVAVVLVSEARFWTVYATYEGAPTYAVADYSERVVAEHVAARLAAASGVSWVTLDF